MATLFNSLPTTQVNTDIPKLTHFISELN
jgi:hypothetical protein